MISRKPKGGKLVRGIANEQQIIAALAEISNVDLKLIDLAAMPLSQQLQHITRSDLLIGLPVHPCTHHMLIASGWLCMVQALSAQLFPACLNTLSLKICQKTFQSWF